MGARTHRVTPTAGSALIAERSVRFRCGDIELDGRMVVPASATRACVVCHPHPLYGGDMNNPVVVAVADALGTAGIATLRFDFRGVGRSGGSHGGGRPEVDDARAAVDALAAATGIANVAIAGYSFGSLIALRLAASSACAAVAAIAPPLVMFDASFVVDLACPSLLLAGDRDSYCPKSEFETLASRLPKRASTQLLAGVDHFFGGREREVAADVARWLAAA